MITEKASVVAVKGEFAWVETQRQTACAGCEAQKGCGTGLWARFFGQKVNRMKVMNPVGADVGDQVVLGLEDAVLVKTSIAVYGVPLALMLLGAGLGDMLAADPGSDTILSDWISVVFAGIGLLAGLSWLKRYAGRSAHDQRRQPYILQALSKNAI